MVSSETLIIIFASVVIAIASIWGVSFARRIDTSEDVKATATAIYWSGGALSFFALISYFLGGAEISYAILLAYVLASFLFTSSLVFIFGK